MRKQAQILGFVAICILLVTQFQNCSGGYEQSNLFDADSVTGITGDATGNYLFRFGKNSYSLQGATDTKLELTGTCEIPGIEYSLNFAIGSTTLATGVKCEQGRFYVVVSNTMAAGSYLLVGGFYKTGDSKNVLQVPLTITR